MVCINYVVALLALSVSTSFAAPGSYFPRGKLITVRATCGNVTTGNSTIGSVATSTVATGSVATGSVATGSVTTVNAGAAAIGKGTNSQFTVGGCINDADCGSQCCAGGAVSGSTGRAGVGVCSGKGSGVEFQKGKTGCGFEDPNAALTLQEAAAQVETQGF